MAAAALVATADGEVSFSELSALDDLLDTVKDLQIYDPHVAVDIYRDFADAIGENRENGRRDALKTVARVADNAEAAALVVRVAVAISRADGDFTTAEQGTIGDLCDALDVPLPQQG